MDKRQRIDEEVKRHKHIIVCGDNINSLNIVRCLGEKGITPMAIIAGDDWLRKVAKSRYIGRVIYVRNYEEALTELLKYADTSCPPFVYSTDDTQLQLLDANYDLLKGKFFFFNAGEQGRLTRFLSKQEQNKLAEECGLRVPRYEEVARGELPQTLNYPVITKTYNSYSKGWKIDVTICYSPEELQEAYQHMVSERLLLQEYVEKVTEYDMQGICINEGEYVYMPFETTFLRYTKDSFGGYMDFKPFKNAELQQKLQRMFKAIGFSGCFEVEFLVDKQNELHFLEINLRFSAHNYGTNVGGFSLPYEWAKATLLGKIEIDETALRKDRYLYMNEMYDANFAKEVGRFKWLGQLLSADGYIYYNKKDIWPLLSRYVQKAQHKIKKILKK